MVPHGSLRRPKALRIAGIKFTDIQLDRYNREKVRISDGFEFHWNKDREVKCNVEK